MITNKTIELKSEKLQILARAKKYKGTLPFFYPANLFPELEPLKENWKAIRDEIVRFENHNGFIKGLDSNPYVAPQFEGVNWSNIFLENFSIRHHKNRKKFPFTSSVLDQIPNLSFAVISVLSPHTQIKPHYGDTNGIVRCHLALIIPDKLPACGIRVGEEEKEWEEGDLVLFTEAYLHSAWNNTSSKRYVLVVDIVPRFISATKNKVCIKLLGAQSFNYLENRFTILKNIPDSVLGIIHFSLSLFWWLYLPIQRRLKIL